MERAEVGGDGTDGAVLTLDITGDQVAVLCLDERSAEASTADYEAWDNDDNEDFDGATDSRDFLPYGPCSELEHVLRLKGGGGGGGGRGKYAHVDGDVPGGKGLMSRCRYNRGCFGGRGIYEHVDGDVPRARVWRPLSDGAKMVR